MGFFTKLKERLFSRKKTKEETEITAPIEQLQQKNNAPEQSNLQANQQAAKAENQDAAAFFEDLLSAAEAEQEQPIKIDLQNKKAAKKTAQTQLSTTDKTTTTLTTTNDFEGKTIKKTRAEKKEAKLEKKAQKARQKQLAKENKLNKYVAGLSKSGTNLTQKIIELQAANNKIDEAFFEQLEEILIMSDISINMVDLILDEIKKEVKKENISDPKLIAEIIADKMFTIYANQSLVDTRLKLDHEGLNILLIVGVNGSGKTTTIAKIAYKLLQENKRILLAAGDTFRAGAVEQLKIWAERLGIDIVTADKEGADPASVVYKAFEKSQQEAYDVLIIDTAVRLQNKINLMNELAKINKIINKFNPEAPHESLLVLDATTGQNGILQAKAFKDVTPISGIVLTKMDGTSNGGIILTIKDQLDIDVKLIGLGEKMDDLQEFDLDAYIYGLMQNFIYD